MSEGLLVALLGMVIVFASLGALILIMVALGRFFKPRGDGGEEG